MGGGFAGTVISRRGAVALSFFGDDFGSAALGRDDLCVVRYRCDIRFWAFGRDDLCVVRYRCDIRFWHLGGMTSVSSGTAAGVADLTNRP